MTTTPGAPLVSVVIPTYNRADLLEGAVNSALGQSHPHIEVVIVDDGSKDDTKARVAAFDPSRVKFIAKANGGASSARNVGLANARGDFIAFLDSDDSWDTHWVRNALQAISAGGRDYGAAYGSIRFVNGNGSQTGLLDITEGGKHSELTLPYALSRVHGTHGLVGSNIVVSRAVIDAAGPWDEKLPTAEDLDLGLRIAAGTRVALVREPLVSLRHTEGSLSKRVGTGNRLKVLEKFEQWQPEVARRCAGALLEAKARVLQSYGEDLLWHRQIAAAQTQLRLSFQTRPSARVALLLFKAHLLRVATAFSTKV